MKYMNVCLLRMAAYLSKDNFLVIFMFGDLLFLKCSSTGYPFSLGEFQLSFQHPSLLGVLKSRI